MSGGGLLWCNARLAAVGFYERAGMVTTGDVWEEPVIGPHIAMFVEVRPPATSLALHVEEQLPSYAARHQHGKGLVDLGQG